jgi:outer membrane protein OmpA-like peptidoglycan-associated protein
MLTSSPLDRRMVLMTRDRLLLPLVLGIAWPLTGCATPQFVRAEVQRSEAVLRPAVTALADDLHQHQMRMGELAVLVTEVDRSGETATRRAIEALGVADVAAGKAAEALEHADLALARAEEADALAREALAEADGTARRLDRLWNARTRVSVVDAVVLRFRVDEWALDDEARAAALAIAKRLQENPGLVVQLEGYADGTGPRPHNIRLSQLRAEAVGRFLVEQGVETHRLRVIGLGDARPVADNGTHQGRRQNRRVLLRLLDPS